jgi:hypothetical protein
LNTLLKTEIQFPLLVEYEENFTVSCKKKWTKSNQIFKKNVQFDYFCFRASS